jgi:hypothetical protein
MTSAIAVKYRMCPPYSGLIRMLRLQNGAALRLDPDPARLRKVVLGDV